MRGERLSQLREAKGVSQVEMAKDLKLGEQQIWRYENGKTEPDGTTIARIAMYLNTSADYLLGLSDDPVPSVLTGGLNNVERMALAAWRRGERMAAVKLIANDE